MSTKQIGPILKAWYRWKSLRLPWRKRFLVGLDLNNNTYWEFRLARGDPAPPSSSSSSSSPSSSSSSYPFRRIVHYPRSTHYSEVAVPPAWHQWLRYRRLDAPTLEEQLADEARQARIKVLAAEADARWRAKESLLDHPGGGSNIISSGKGREKGPQQATTTASSERTTQPPREQHVRAAGKQGRGRDGNNETTIAMKGRERDEGKGKGKDKESSSPTDAAKRRVESAKQQERTTDSGTKTKKTTNTKEEEEGKNPWKSADEARKRMGGPSETWQPQAWDPTTTTTTTKKSTSSGRRGR